MRFWGLYWGPLYMETAKLLEQSCWGKSSCGGNVKAVRKIELSLGKLPGPDLDPHLASCCQRVCET